jgi:hypothetical protein
MDRKPKIVWLFVILAIAAIAFTFTQRSSTEVFLTRSGKARKADAYHVVAYRDRKFIIEHRDHRLTVKCERALSWLDGPNNDPQPFSDPGECVYIKVGEYIGEDLMVETSDKLQYHPWSGEDTVQTADIMTITDDEIR